MWPQVHLQRMQSRLFLGKRKKRRRVAGPKKRKTRRKTRGKRGGAMTEDEVTEPLIRQTFESRKASSRLLKSSGRPLKSNGGKFRDDCWKIAGVV